MSRHIPVSALPVRYQNQIAAQIEPRGIAQARAETVAPASSKPRLRQQTGPILNETEASFLVHLKSCFPRAEIRVQSFTLKLANGLRYTPDFVVIEREEGRPAPFSATDYLGMRVTAYETKGHMRDDAAAKIKMAARVEQWMRFILVTKRKGGGWDMQEILP